RRGSRCRSRTRSTMIRHVIRRLAIVLSVAGACVVSVGAQVGFDRLLNAAREPHNWLTYSGDLTGRRYSSLTSITPANVGNLQLEWVLQTMAPAEATQKYEASPLVVDGVMYTVQPPNVIV